MNASYVILYGGNTGRESERWNKKLCFKLKRIKKKIINIKSLLIPVELLVLTPLKK